MLEWIVHTLQNYPQLAIFLVLGIGFMVGPIKLAGFNLGSVTATLLAGVLIGQLQIEISADVKNTFFILFLFAVGFGVGPQFMRGLTIDGPKQIAFAVSVLALCLIVPYLCALAAGLPLGYAAGFYAGSQTISAAIGVASDQIGNLGLTSDQAKSFADQIPIAYAVTYIFGTIGSAIILAQLGPKLLGIDLVAACKEYEATLGGGTNDLGPGIFSSYHNFTVRAYRIDAKCNLTGKPVQAILPGIDIFAERIRRGDELIDVDAATVLQVGDIVAFSGPRKLIVNTSNRF